MSISPHILAILVEATDDADSIQAIERANPVNDDVNAVVIACLGADATQQPLFNHRIEGFVQYDVPKYNDATFKAHFRMERATFQLLLEELAPELKTRVVDPTTKLLSVIWLLATEESYRSVADRFDMSKGSLHFHMILVVELISEKIKEFITWPSTQEMRVVADINQQSNGFPGCFGFVDGCHIPIKGRRENGESFINRMGFSSILVQAVCDVNMKFIHIYVGWPGSIHDARMFRNSDLTELLEDVPLDLHILGDSAYPLNVALLTPYRDNGKLTAAQKKFNTIHSASRSVVERAFGLLKGKFRRLKYLDMSLDLKIPAVISTCIALHNYILSHEKRSMHECCDISEENPEGLVVGNFANAAEKRDKIATAI